MKKKKKSKAKNTGSLKAIRNLWIIFGSLLLLVILFFFCVAKGLFGTMPTFDELENPKTNLATEIISADGKVLGTYYVENRSNVRYAELSHYMPEALISIEDERFTEHSGIDKRTQKTQSRYCNILTQRDLQRQHSLPKHNKEEKNIF